VSKTTIAIIAFMWIFVGAVELYDVYYSIKLAEYLYDNELNPYWKVFNSIGWWFCCAFHGYENHCNDWRFVRCHFLFPHKEIYSRMAVLNFSLFFPTYIINIS